MSLTAPRVVIAPDSFKESLPAPKVAAAIAAGLREFWPDAHLTLIPMADGGEGTVDAIHSAVGGELRTVTVTGPLGSPVEAAFCITPGHTAVVEMAASTGLELVPPSQRDPLVATSIGFGELLLAAAQSGATRIVAGIGGSATVDGGAGMLQALGAHLLDPAGHEIPRGGAGLAHLDRIDLSGLSAALRGIPIVVACDVNSPLIGPRGAAAVFGPQKGATPAAVARLDAGLSRLAEIIARDVGPSIAELPGAGAAGGVGGALVACLNATLRPGVEIVAELTRLDQAIRGADLVITGEGRVDSQTARGKTPAGVAAIARRHGCPVIALAGSVGAGAESLYDGGITAIFPIMPGPIAREEAFATAASNLQRTARNIAALWSVSSAWRREALSVSAASSPAT